MVKELHGNVILEHLQERYFKIFFNHGEGVETKSFNFRAF